MGYIGRQDLDKFVNEELDKIKEIENSTTEKIKGFKKEISTQYEDFEKKTDKRVRDFIDTKGQQNGIAGLDEHGKVKKEQLSQSEMWEKIAEITVEQNTEQIVFSNINKYRYFKIILEAQSCKNYNDVSYMDLYFNDDLESSNYENKCIIGSYRIILGEYNDGYSYVSIIIPNLYGFTKETRIKAQVRNEIIEYLRTWRNTSQINKITLIVSDKFRKNSHFALWGYK
ncbi:hypothetical protein G8S55_06790 [Clostridium botulinum C]|uniref:hypothetical protein n=1 Tax=Clostridium botulinum TaxID=1491 RepID=UPI001E4F71C8|nr:hypothetical protein [Clostridium botulinum]MCD3216959.1 hypothetical protein [Clostridium botulinum C]